MKFAMVPINTKSILNESGAYDQHVRRVLISYNPSTYAQETINAAFTTSVNSGDANKSVAANAAASASALFSLCALQVQILYHFQEECAQ